MGQAALDPPKSGPRPVTTQEKRDTDGCRGNGSHGRVRRGHLLGSDATSRKAMQEPRFLAWRPHGLHNGADGSHNPPDKPREYCGAIPTHRVLLRANPQAPSQRAIWARRTISDRDIFLQIVLAKNRSSCYCLGGSLGEQPSGSSSYGELNYIIYAFNVDATQCIESIGNAESYSPFLFGGSK